VGPRDAVLDLGCGWGEFINHIHAGEKFAMDINDAREHLAPGVTFRQHDCATSWPTLHHRGLDVIFSSNFFEHLPTKAHLERTLKEAYAALRSGGRLICLGPNIRYVGGAYWDFFDHHLPLTDRSLVEALELTGFRVTDQIPRFLPYTMSEGFQPPIAALRLYLHLPFIWRLVGRQFLIVAIKE
jgi:SAM-dependent methyltransferase